MNSLITKLSDAVSKVEAYDFEDLVIPVKPGHIKVKTDLGDEFDAYALYDEPDVTVIRIDAKAGARMPFHVHDETEIITTTKGMIRLNIGNRVVLIPARHTYVVEAGVEHEGFFDLDSEAIIITLPSGRGMPKK
jgi:quercetin dioxygenase-like cupin family protein